jgi:biopolymer transport protein ExbD
MDKRYLLLIPVALIAAVLVFVGGFTLTTYLIIDGVIPTGVTKPVVESDQPDPVLLESRIWELTEENEALKAQVESYEDMVISADDRVADAEKASDDLRAEVKKKSRPVVVNADKVAEKSSPEVSETLPEPPLILDYEGQ